MTSDNEGARARAQSVREIGSEETAWAMPARHRAQCRVRGETGLATVEADGALLGVRASRLWSWRARKDPRRGRSRERGFGRCRIQLIDDARSSTTQALRRSGVAPRPRRSGAVVLTDALSNYPFAWGVDS